MSNDKKIYKVYIKSTKEFLEVDKDFYYLYYKPVWATLQKMQRKGQCICPKSCMCFCDGDCIDCEYYNPPFVSLDSSIIDDNIPLHDSLSANSDNDFDEEICERVNDIVSTLSEEDQILCRCLMNGYSASKIKAAIGYTGTDNAFYAYKKRKMDKFQSIFSEFQKFF